MALSLRIMGAAFKKWVWLAKFPQTDPPLEKSWLRPCVCMYYFKYTNQDISCKIRVTLFRGLHLLYSTAGYPLRQLERKLAGVWVVHQLLQIFPFLLHSCKRHYNPVTLSQYARQCRAVACYIVSAVTTLLTGTGGTREKRDRISRSSWWLTLRSYWSFIEN